MSDPEPEPESLSARRRGVSNAGGRLARAFSAFALVLVGAAVASSAVAQGVEASAAAEIVGRSPGLLLASFAGLLLLSGMVSGTETAIFSLNKLDLVKTRRKDSRSSRALLYLVENPNDSLTTILVVNNVVNVALSLTAGALTETYYSGQTMGGFALAAFGATSLLLIFGEVVPKCIAHVKAPLVASAVAWPTMLLARAIFPLCYVMNRLIQATFSRLGVSAVSVTGEVTEGELKAMISTREVATLLEEDEREMIHGVFELGHTFADEIMIPRTQVEAYPDSLNQEQMLETMRKTRFSRLLIHGENLDQLTGYVLAKEILLNPERDWQESIREVLCVPARARLVDLLTRFRRNHTKIAVLADEYGGVAGIVTLRDLLEEIVGDMPGHHERVAAEIEELGPGRWRVSGQTNLDELEQRIATRFPDDLGNTIGGFVMSSLGKMPTSGARLEHNGLSITVTRMLGRRIAQLEIALCGEDAEGPAPGTGEGNAT